MWEDDWFTWSLTPSRRTRQIPFGLTNFNDIFNRLEKILNEATVERRRTLSLTVTEGDNDAIDKAIEMLESMRVSEEKEEVKDSNEASVEASETKENFNEDFKEDHA